MHVLVCDPISPRGIAYFQARPEFKVTVLSKRLSEAELLPLLADVEVRAWANTAGVIAVETARAAMATTRSDLRMVVLSLQRRPICASPLSSDPRLVAARSTIGLLA